MVKAKPAKAAPTVEKKLLRRWSKMDHYEVVLKAHHQALGNDAGKPIDWSRADMRIKDRTPSACKHEYNERIKMHMNMVMRGEKVTGYFDHEVAHDKCPEKNAPSGSKRKADEIDEDGDAAEGDIKPNCSRGPVKKMSTNKVNVEVEDDSESEAEAKSTLKRKALTKKPVAKGKKAKVIDLE